MTFFVCVCVCVLVCVYYFLRVMSESLSETFFFVGNVFLCVRFFDRIYVCFIESFLCVT